METEGHDDPGKVMHIASTVDSPWPVLSHPQEELWPVVSPWIESPLQVIEVFLIIVGNGYVNLISRLRNDDAPVRAG